MIVKALRKVFGTRNQRLLKSFEKDIAKINSLEEKIKLLSNDDFKTKTDELRLRYKNGETLVALLPEAFALVREASVRTLGLRHFDVQLIGGMVLHLGKIAEMRTGEGKTLVATLPVYLNALTSKSVHVITVNDYLARRDAAWMGPIYNLLGLTVGVIIPGQDYNVKKENYACDVVYGTNNEFGFDYLRDNMVFSLEDKVQRGLYYAIVDEVDSILIDEARTPLIISGPTEENSELYVKLNQLIPLLKKQAEKDGPGDFVLDEKIKQAFLTEEGHQRVEDLLIERGMISDSGSLYEARNVKLMHYLNAALRAHHLFHRDVDYIVRDNEVIIVDEHTGRTMEGRRWSDGLHQAVEAKEGAKIQNENQTLASITFQNYFRLYEKLAGMTGTADTEAYEFQQIYGLEVVVIPTHMNMIRADLGDQIYLTAKVKFNSVIQDIKERHQKGQPLLVGTSSIETSEKVAELLKQEKIEHQILNAKQHEREAKIIAHAGKPGAVTIATNMAGRGTDIVLGGNLEAEIADLDNPTPEEMAKIKTAWQERHNQVVVAGGLHVIGSERHESRRIDNQLRGRSGRQGDPGSSRFYLSLEDNLMRIFASDRVAAFMKKIGMQDEEVIEHPFITRAVEGAQRKVEGHNFDIRKHLLEFDDVANEQRKVVYSQRDALMAADNVAETVEKMLEDVVTAAINLHIPPQSLEEQWNIEGLEKQLQQDFGIHLEIKKWLSEDVALNEETLRARIITAAKEAYKNKEQQIGSEIMRQVEKTIMLQSLDIRWKEHLSAMDHLREGIHLRGYAQQNPKQEYKRESFKMFQRLLEDIKYDVIRSLFVIQVRAREDVEALEEERRKAVEEQKMQFIHANAAAISAEPEADTPPPELQQHIPFVRENPKVGRNDPCPCGSGKKFKNCCGKIA